ncbi:MAG: restriction endonuclease subunit S [Clostridiales bacterium]|nr:restriction endonuclease subunit S [Clostridiales bacterium]
MGGLNAAEKSGQGGRPPGKIDASLNKKLASVEWGEYTLGDLFEIKSSAKRFDANKVAINSLGKYPYIVRMGYNNGQKGFLNEDEIYLNEGNTISFGQDTATMYYQEAPYFTGDKIKILHPKLCKFRKENAQFFLTSMKQAFSGFSWGSSQFNEGVLKKQTILLPFKNHEIDFAFMESFIAELEAQRITGLDTYLSGAGLKDTTLTDAENQALLDFADGRIQWKEYRIGSLFERIETNKLPYKAKELPKNPVGNYTLPCLTSSFHNQGLSCYATKENATVLKGVISIPSNSDVYRAYYQSREFTVLSDAYAIRWSGKEDLSPNQYLFTVACINKRTNLSIYSYKNKLGGWNVVKDKLIQLPVRSGVIDVDFIERFVSAIKKLTIDCVVTYNAEKMNAAKPL